jgi:uncharacterized membrane protein YdjX (TVP38/TMEM64 family)
MTGTGLPNLMTDNDTKPDPSSGRVPIAKLVPLALLGLGLGLVLWLDLDRYLAFETLKDNRDALTAWVAENGILAGAAFIGIYAVTTALSVPGAAILTISSGFLFGAVIGTMCSVTGATMGAVIVFAAARTALGDLLRAKAGPRLKKMEAGFRENAFSYLLVLRLIPIFPFWLINLAPAFLGVSVRVFFAATFIGIIPGGFVFALVGAGLGSIFDRGETFSMSGILTPEIVAALVGLALLSVLPVAYKKFKSRSYIGS